MNLCSAPCEISTKAMARPARSSCSPSPYLLPIVFCVLLIALALTRNCQQAEPALAYAGEEETLVLNRTAMENYVYAAGFLLQGEELMDASGSSVGTLALTEEDAAVTGFTLTLPIPIYFETDYSDELTLQQRLLHEQGEKQAMALFFQIYEAISATDSRLSSLKSNAQSKLLSTLNTGKSATQSANTWRFSFSLETSPAAETLYILGEKVK